MIQENSWSLGYKHGYSSEYQESATLCKDSKYELGYKEGYQEGVWDW